MAAIAIGAMLIFSVAGIQAFADNVEADSIETNLNSVTVDVGESAPIKYWIQANNGDGETGCNAKPDSPAIVNINAPSKVVASPSQLPFTGCGSSTTNFKVATLTSDTPGTYEITASVSDNGPGTYNTNPAKVTLTVVPKADTTAPTLNLPKDITKEATGPTEVTYTATATDNGQDVPITCTPASGSTFQLGTTTVNCSAKDAAGNEAKGSFTVTVTKPADQTKPTISITSPSNGATLTTDSITVEGTASDADSGLAKVEVKVGSGSYSGASGTSTWSAQVTLAEGENTITAQATDKAEPANTATDSVTVTYTPPDTTPPKFDPALSDMTVEATKPEGADVSYKVTATDDRDPSPTVTCKPESGSTFPLGTTPVACTATDATGNKADGSFNIKVVDTTAPTLELPTLTPIEATGPNGAIVTYTATAKDLVDGSFAASCTPASESEFALGTTEVTCDAKDKAGNAATAGTFKVTVQDKTAPKLTVPADMSIKATGADGAKVTYTATATDAVDANPTITCTPASDSTFPVGTTTVSCTATDHSGNTSPAATFKVSVTLTMAGFYQPVDMGSTINTVKAGSTVPFKFEIFAGTTELTSTTFNGNPIGAFTAKKVACTGGTEDPIEQVVTATGGTVLRYDSTSGQFVYNWQTPKTPAGACYDTTFTVTADGSTLTAHFKAK
jgi:hypothetical protein